MATVGKHIGYLSVEYEGMILGVKHACDLTGKIYLSWILHCGIKNLEALININKCWNSGILFIDYFIYALLLLFSHFWISLISKQDPSLVRSGTIPLIERLRGLSPKHYFSLTVQPNVWHPFVIWFIIIYHVGELTVTNRTNGHWFELVGILQMLPKSTVCCT